MRFLKPILPFNLDFSKVKQALNSHDDNDKFMLFETFKRIDGQLQSSLKDIQSALTSLPIMVESENEAIKETVIDYLKTPQFLRMFYDIAEYLIYGYAYLIKQTTKFKEQYMPAYCLLNHKYIHTNEDEKYFYNSFQKEEIDTRFKEIYFRDEGLIDAFIAICSLKYLAIKCNVNYLDLLSIPPIVINANTNSEEEAQEILKAADRLRSDSIALFSNEHTINLLNGNVDSKTFLDFINKFDEYLSKVAIGSVLTSNAVSYGTQALGKIHAENKLTLISSHAKVISAYLTEIFQENNINVKFILDTNTEEEELKSAQIVQLLSNAGIRIPINELEKRFNIQGLSYTNGVSELSENSTQTRNIPLIEKLDKTPILSEELRNDLLSETFKSFLDGLE